jgi:hypothetical protein
LRENSWGCVVRDIRIIWVIEREHLGFFGLLKVNIWVISIIEEEQLGLLDLLKGERLLGLLKNNSWGYCRRTVRVDLGGVGQHVVEQEKLYAATDCHITRKSDCGKKVEQE